MTALNVTQVAVEEWGPAVPPQLQITQAAIEEWGTVNPAPFTLVITQVAIEQWGSVRLGGGAFAIHPFV